MSNPVANKKVIDLFEYIKALGNIRINDITDVKNQFWYQFVSDIPAHPDFVTVHNRDTVEGAEYDDILLEVKKPPLFLCPDPGEDLKGWLNEGWDKPSREVSFIERKPIESKETASTDTLLQEYDLFSDDEKRVRAYEEWKIIRDEWAAEQLKRIKVRDLFTALYKLHVTLERDTDTRELLIGNGLLTDRRNRSISHPVMLKRVKTEFDAINNIIRIVDTDKTPELYTSLLTNTDGLNIESLSSFSEQLSIKDCHPLDRIEAKSFLKNLIHTLSSDSQFIETDDDYRSARFQIKMEPVFFERARRDGAPKMIEAIIEDINNRGDVPNHLISLVGEGKIVVNEDSSEKTLPQQLAEVGGEDPEILLTKPANKEQLEIARRISNYDAVLVQGPPGTGKTHTIANLLGHFLSQGKTVLVTSYTKKALSVVKGQVDSDLQDLCVSVLDDDNRDMEKSVSGISDMITKYTAHDLLERINATEIERKIIINRLSEVRQTIFTIKQGESSASIVIGGQAVTPSEAARYIQEHPNCDIIPGKVELYRSLPLSAEELQFLYSSNTDVTSWEESEMDRQLSDPSAFMTPEVFSQNISAKERVKETIEKECASHGYRYNIDDNGSPVLYNEQNKQTIRIADPSRPGLDALNDLLSRFTALEDWMIYAAVDGRAGGSRADNWQKMISLLQKTIQYAETVDSECFGKKVVFQNGADKDFLAKTIPMLVKDSYGKEKLGKLAYVFHPDYKTAENMVTINGKPVCNFSEYQIVEHILRLNNMRDECARYWNELMATRGMPMFNALDDDHPERIAGNLIPEINKYLSWYQDEFPNVQNVLHELGISQTQLFAPSPLDTEIVEMKKVLNSVSRILPMISTVIDCFLEDAKIEALIDRTYATVTDGSRAKSKLCNDLLKAVQSRSGNAYQYAYQAYKEVYDKQTIRKKRIILLEKLKKVAPDWSLSIQNRDRQHGMDIVPSNIEEAWLWKQYSLILKNLSKESLEQLQEKGMNLSKRYRETTAELAKWKAWYALKRRIDSNPALKASLKSWALSVKKIGKSSKLGSLYKQAARDHMINCQEAVPAWIMPISKVFESYTPGKNFFDVVIVDEASQSDISALAITYLGKKIIIVGDDKQVSPSGIGVELNQMLHLAEGTIKDRIRSWELYASPTTSLYDIVSIAYSDLMLREHFRCVPDIIGYSNRLSYEYKIKPLRDTSDCLLLPAVINYRVNNGHRNGERKQNDAEARTIIALLKACMERKEYDGKTFGIISLLGDEQTKLIEKYLFQQFGADEIDRRKIIYGTSAQFQGDERDVIFLSMVDSNENESGGPIKMVGNGTQDANRKRYNVAASRAKDQLWVVNSLDPGMDLKEGDIRKGLLDYASNPHAYQQQAEEVTAHAESPFEEAVGKALVAKGYSLVQQWPVGAYRIDMVVVDGKKRVAIECDGERWHSTDLQVRKDMERQTILERLGWRFIRIRGSEYYKNPDDTMERVFNSIDGLNIHPTNQVDAVPTADSQLLADIRRRAEELLSSDGFTFEAVDEKATIRFALDGKNTRKKAVPEIKPAPVRIEPSSQPEPVKQAKEQKAVVTKAESKKAPSKAEPKKKTVASKAGSSTVEHTRDHSTVRQFERTRAVQQTLFDTVDKPSKPVAKQTDRKSDPVIALIMEKGIPFVDKRAADGALWIIGGKELEPFVQQCNALGSNFKFKQDGAKATGKQPAWWTK